jgi:hypothetical protein
MQKTRRRLSPVATLAVAGIVSAYACYYPHTRTVLAGTILGFTTRPECGTNQLPVKTKYNNYIGDDAINGNLYGGIGHLTKIPNYALSVPCLYNHCTDGWIDYGNYDIIYDRVDPASNSCDDS